MLGHLLTHAAGKRDKWLYPEIATGNERHGLFHSGSKKK
jgi:hypothetical protein